MSYKIGKVARMVGLTTQTLREYEKLGLLEARKDEESGYRYFDAQMICKSVAIRYLRNLGFTLGEVSDLLHEMDYEEYCRYFDTVLERQREALAYQALVCEVAEEQVRSIRALKETRHACNILPEMEFYCLDYLRSGDPLLREQRELQLLNSWIGYSMFARNYSPLPLASLSGPWEAESVMGLALRGDYARKLKLSTEYPAYLRQSPRCVCTRVSHPKSINAWPAPGDLTRVRRFLEENALEPAGEPFFISDCTLWEGGEERSYSILYVPIA